MNMIFFDWFQDKWQKPDETFSTALARLHVETGVSPMAIRRALDGEAIKPNTALRLSKAAKDDVSPSELVFPGIP